MRPARIVTAVVLPLVLLSACTSSHPTAQTPSTTAPAVGQTTQTPAPTSQTRATSSQPPPTIIASTSPGKSRPVLPPVTKKPLAKPGTGLDPLTGGRMSLNPVIAVKIDNTYFDVPQFGVSDADIVFVEQVEGGLTRLIAVFHSSLPAEVGPVRSVRSTDAQLLPVFGMPGLVFSGGAGGPLGALAATRVVDTSALEAAYFRSNLASGSYNLHADLTKIAGQIKRLGPVRSIGFAFEAHSPLVAAGKPVSSIRVVMQAGGIDFRWTSGHFVRLRNGQPVADYQGAVQAADNVLVLKIVDQPDGTVDSIGSPSYLSKTVGSGRATLYRDGHAVEGSWKRGTSTDPFVFTDSAGKPLPFKPGKTWVMLAPQTSQISTG